MLYYRSLQLRQIGEEPETFNMTVQEVVNLVHLLANINSIKLAPVKISEVILSLSGYSQTSRRLQRGDWVLQGSQRSYSSIFS